MTEAISVDWRILADLGEHFASGYWEKPQDSPMRRWSRAVRRRFERRTLTPYAGSLLYPHGPKDAGDCDRILQPSYSFTYAWNEQEWQRRMAQATAQHQATLIAMRDEVRQLQDRIGRFTTPHTIGGAGYTHSIPHYGRVLCEGLDGYETRIRAGLGRAERQDNRTEIDFYLGLLDVLAGIRAWHSRILDMLGGVTACSRGADKERCQRLVAALKRIPFRPAESFYEAVVAYNLIYYLDDCDNPGRVDQELWPFYEADAAAGLTSYREAVDCLRELWENTDANNGWSAGIGGTTPEGEPAYNALTLASLEAAQCIRRPNLQLHVRRDMPPAIWDAALETISSGCGLPALYHEEAYLQALRDAHLGLREQDLGWHNGGGCTETMVHGRSNVGSLDAGLNLPMVLSKTLRDHLPSAADFAALLDAFKTDVCATIAEIVAQVNVNQQGKARWQPQPMRSLLVDDCIEKGIEFNGGGARYNWSVINIAGLANVADSLAAVREVVFEEQVLTGAELLSILQRDFVGEEGLRKRLCQCPRYGNDQLEADGLAAEVAEFVFREFLRYVPWRGGKFLSSCLMFVTYAQAGAPVAATPDGRHAGEPIADSAGPHQGRDTHGPTALLKSVASIPQALAPGTLVVNARFSAEMFACAASQRRLQDLIRTYFDLGGMQIQINVVDQEVLRDAIAHPEKHGDLIVRVGGYSEYFNRLSPDLKRTVLERTEHSA